MTGEIDALIESFAGEPELHHPVRGTDQGRAGVRRVCRRNRTTGSWNATSRFENVERVVTDPRGFEEVILHLDE